MIRIAVVGDIGSGKSYAAKQFGYPVFNADFEVAKIYKKSKKCYNKLKKALPSYINTFPVNKSGKTSILSNCAASESPSALNFSKSSSDHHLTKLPSPS